jgi:telomerase reverse transcriptase
MKVVYDKESRAEILELLEEHITENVVKAGKLYYCVYLHLIRLCKIGKSYYKQVVGIPQGSILSSILCSFFYGDLEEKRMPWHKDPDCVRGR